MRAVHATGRRVWSACHHVWAPNTRTAFITNIGMTLKSLVSVDRKHIHSFVYYYPSTRPEFEASRTMPCGSSWTAQSVCRPGIMLLAFSYLHGVSIRSGLDISLYISIYGMNHDSVVIVWKPKIPYSAVAPICSLFCHHYNAKLASTQLLGSTNTRGLT